MKFLIIASYPGSILRFRGALIKALQDKGFEIHIAAPEFEFFLEDYDNLTALGYVVHPITMQRTGTNPLSDAKTLYALYLLMNKIKPSHVMSYTIKPVIYGSLAARFAKVPRVIGMLEGLGYAFTEQPEGISKKTKFIKSTQVFLYKIALPQLDNIIFLNPDDPKDLLETYHIKVKQVDILGGIGLGLDEYDYQPIYNIESPINFLFIGRMLKEKGIYDFIAAAKIVKQNYPDVQFTVLGAIDSSNPGALQPPELDRLISLNILNYPGQVDNVQKWIAESHVFVLPSYREGVPRSTQEAMAIGRAVITTNVPGCRETVIDGVNGFLVEKWNPQALAEKMIYFIEYPEEIKKMGYESYKIAQDKFDADKVNKRLIDMLGL